jgi:hypothetical protein
LDRANFRAHHCRQAFNEQLPRCGAGGSRASGLLTSAYF